MPQSGSPATELSSSDEIASFPQKDRKCGWLEYGAIYPYECLRVVSANPVTGIDLTKREVYLSYEEFREKFGMPKSVFYKLPRWKDHVLDESYVYLNRGCAYVITKIFEYAGLNDHVYHACSVWLPRSLTHSTKL